MGYGYVKTNLNLLEDQEMSEPTITASEMHQKRFQLLIEDLTGRVGRCVTRDLDQISLLDPVKLRMVGALTEYVRKHWAELPQQFEDAIRKVQWEIRGNAYDHVLVMTSVGAFKFPKEGHEAYAHDPFWFRSRRHP